MVEKSKIKCKNESGVIRMSEFKMKVIPEPKEGTRAVLNIQGIPVRLGNGANDLLCGKCGKKVIVGLPDINMISENEMPVVARCDGCGAYNEIPLLSKESGKKI